MTTYGTGTIARVTGLDELAQWLAAGQGRGADRHELWQKTRGSEQARVHVGAASEPFDLADELLSRVEADRRVEFGTVSYVVFAYRGEEKTPIERAFVSPATHAVAMPVAENSAGGGAGAAPQAAALASVLSTMQGMTREVFGSLQRENEHQRRTNEAMVRASAGTFETFAKGYERTFGDLQTRLENALQEAAGLRTKNEALERDKKDSATALEDLRKVNTREAADAELRKRREETGFELLKFVAPVVLAKLTNKPIDPGAMAGPAFAAFLDSITEDQLPTVLGAFREPQRLFVMELLNAHKASKKSAVSHMVAGVVDGAANAARTANVAAPPAQNTQAAPDTTNARRTSNGTTLAVVPAPAANDADTPLEREFKHFSELLEQHGADFQAWVAREDAKEKAAKSKASAPVAEATKPEDSA